ncbi:hypothetical protein GpartN1_g7554.t1 [Galdieria partita]|uniref:UPF0547 domain-containing protein n=1 Tax=Galdieria partita TaxID=83374 RepID=A0A9C7Q3C8_9RHOD|nr:hypothetical protein GpartN1_g7554.t1 [Galdieria partita]
MNTYPPVVEFSWNMGQETPFLLGSTSKRISFNLENEDKQEQKNTDEMQQGQCMDFATTCLDETLSEDIYFSQGRCTKEASSSSMNRRPLNRNIPLGTKRCSQCQTHIPAAIATCTYCGYSFRIKKEIKKSSSGERGKKLCPKCQDKLPAAKATCPTCNYIFRQKIIMKTNKQ